MTDISTAKAALAENTLEIPQLVDLFCGAGGLATGFTDSGFNTVLASDIWPAAGSTYQSNFPGHQFKLADIRDLDFADTGITEINPDSLVVAGGPPCQGFSSAGARRQGDERNTLVSAFAHKAIELQPAVIVFENVEGFLTLDGGRFVLDLLQPLVEAGYCVRLEKHNVANFGVPQLRKRVIAIAALNRIPAPLTETNSARGMPGADLIAQDKPPVMGVLDYLQANSPKPGDSLNIPRDLSDIELRRVKNIAQGRTMKDLPPELQHDSWNGRANRRVRDGMATEKRGGAPTGMRRLVAQDPSKAITSAAIREFIHPTEDRFITQREAALIQTFPREYAFIGTQSEINTLIGNAIPPLFAKAIAGAVIQTMKADKDSHLRGGLHSVRLTNSSGVSPALARTQVLLENTFGATNSQNNNPRLF